MDPVDVVNLALQDLGSAPATGMDDTNYPQTKAITQYPLSRVQVLRAAEWPTITNRAELKNMADQACPWLADTEYRVGDRVTHDTLKTYKCTTAGISDESGGPTGTGSGITDNTVTWAYVEASTALNNWSWCAATAYSVGDLITADNFKVYNCITAGTSGAASPPSGTTDDQTDGTAHWDYYGTPPPNYTVYGYRYIKPVDCLRILKLPKATETKESDQGEQYTLEGITIYCDRDDATIKYIIDETDPTRWDGLLRQAVATHVAQAICMVVTKKKDLSVLLFQKWLEIKQEANNIAMDEGKEAPPEPERWEDA